MSVCGIKDCTNEASETLTLVLPGEVVGYPMLGTEMALTVGVCTSHYAWVQDGTLGNVSIDEAELSGGINIVRRPAP